MLDIKKATQKSDGLPDTDIVSFVNTLGSLGYETLQSCGGHRSDEHNKFISDGHLWIKLTDDQLCDIDFEKLKCRNFSRVALMKHPEECLEVIFLGNAHNELENSMRILFDALNKGDSYGEQV